MLLVSSYVSWLTRETAMERRRDVRDILVSGLSETKKRARHHEVEDYLNCGRDMYIFGARKDGRKLEKY
jgi:hypothetical protein